MWGMRDHEEEILLLQKFGFFLEKYLPVFTATGAGDHSTGSQQNWWTDSIRFLSFPNAGIRQGLYQMLTEKNAFTAPMGWLHPSLHSSG